MHTTIRDILAREQVRQQTTAQPLNQDNDQEDGALLSPDDIGQQEQQQQEAEIAKQGQGEFPMHEVNAEPTRYPEQHARALHSFLKNAAGGTGTFVTSNNDSHEMAKALAKSGHLQHHGARPGGAGGGIRHVWSLTPKGMTAIGQRATQGKKPGFGQNQNRGGFGQQKPMFGRR